MTKREFLMASALQGLIAGGHIGLCHDGAGLEAYLGGPEFGVGQRLPLREALWRIVDDVERAFERESPTQAGPKPREDESGL